MEKHTLKVAERKITGHKVKALRASGLAVANVYGKGVKSVSIQVDAKEFAKVYQSVGESTLVYMQIEGEKEDRPVLVRKVVYHPVSGKILHIDFNQVSLKEKITAPVSIELTGESPAVKAAAGILVQQMNEVEIEALPTDMPEHITVDISILAEVDQAIYVKDLKIDSKLTLKEDLESIIVKIEKLAAEEKVEAPVVAEGETPATEGSEAAPAAEGSDQAAKPAEEKA